MRRRRSSVSRWSRVWRSAHLMCCSRSAQPWHGWRAQLRAQPQHLRRPRCCRCRRAGAGRCRAAGPARAGSTRGRGAPAVSGGRVLGHPDVAEHVRGDREVDDRHPARPARLGDHERMRVVAQRQSGIDDDGKSGSATGRHADHVARPQRLQRLRDRRLARHARPAATAPPRGRTVPAQRGVLVDVAQMAGQLLSYSASGLLVAADLLGEARDAAVGLELREGRLEQAARGTAAQLADEIDRHVVGRAERRAQRVGAGRGEPGDPGRVDVRAPQHDGVALDVDAAAAGASGQLGVLPRRQVGMRLAVELGQPLEDDRARRHVDSQRERLGREDRLDQPADEQLLDGLLERRDEPGVVRGEPAAQPVAPVPVAEHLEILGREVRSSVRRRSRRSPRARPRR